MALTITALVDATPYRLRYLATQDGVITSPSNPDVDALATIPNNGGATPDLRTDIETVSVSGAGGIPLREIIRARLDGFGPLAPGALTQAQARAIMNSDDPTSAVLTNQRVGRAVCRVYPRTGNNVPWAVDVNVDGQGDPVIEVRSGTGTAATAYVDVHFRHTDDL